MQAAASDDGNMFWLVVRNNINKLKKSEGQS
jgi:hypothetical protein